jgi:hypothetical protein
MQHETPHHHSILWFHSLLLPKTLFSACILLIVCTKAVVRLFRSKKGSVYDYVCPALCVCGSFLLSGRQLFILCS